MRTRTSKLALGLIITSAFLAPETARAGEYPLRACNVSGFPAAGIGPWTWFYPEDPNIAVNNCASGGGFGIHLSPTSSMARARAAFLVLDRPESGPKAAINLRNARIGVRTRLSGTHLTVVPHSLHGGSAISSGAIATPSENGNAAFEWSSPTFTDGTRGFRIGLYCSSDGPACPATSDIPLLINAATVTLEEGQPPQVSLTGGSLTSGAAQRGTQSISYDASDQESGIQRVQALISGHVVAQTDPTVHGCLYASWNACQESASGDLSIDTRGVPDGVHTMQLRALDAAGNLRATQSPTPITIGNGPHSTVGSATADYKLTAAFRRKRTSTVEPWSRRATVTGRLTDRAGKPIPGAPIEVMDPGRASRRHTVSTDAKGRFRYRAVAKRPTRRLIFRYTGATGAVERQLHLRSRAGIRQKISLRGVRVRYTVRVLSGPRPRKGKLVLVQGRAAGARWTTFARRRSSRSGQLTGRYRLRVRRPGVRLQFRVVLPTERGFPYAITRSRTILKTVR